VRSQGLMIFDGVTEEFDTFVTLDQNFINIALGRYNLMLTKVNTKKEKSLISEDFEYFLSDVGYRRRKRTILGNGFSLHEKYHYNPYFNQNIAYVYYN